MLDRSLIGKSYPEIIFSVEKQRLKLFAKATQQSNPIYFDEVFAKKNGYPSILAPLTFLTTVGYDQGKPYQYLQDLGVPIGNILHASQEYTNYDSIYAGDELRMESRIGEIYDKKEGMLEFVSFVSKYKNQKRILVAESVSTIVLRNNENK
ncbi:MAG: MaoC family dehydratase N-terminal domain-containing protein [Fidelibacterota bacterium]|jgi:acyl dehydratase|tara:strand:+ start:3090 stop:3542 length:453 start_codon:yes stop_codon:yes gene_type:complete